MGKYGRRSRRRISDKRKITLKRKYRNRKTLKRKRNKKTLKQMGGMFRRKKTNKTNITLLSVYEKFGSKLEDESDLYNKLVTLFKHNYVLAPAVVLYKDAKEHLRFIVVSNMGNSTKFTTDQSNEIQMQDLNTQELKSGSSNFKLEGSDPVQVFLFNLINNSSDLLNLFTINAGTIQIKPKYLIVANDKNIVYYTDKNKEPTIVANINPTLDTGLEIVYPDMFPHDNSENYFMMDYLLKNLNKNPGSFPTDTLSKEIEQLSPVSSDRMLITSTVIISNKNGKYTLSQMYNDQSEIVHRLFDDTQSSKFNFVRTIAELRELFFNDHDDKTALVFVNNGYFYYITKTFVVEDSGIYADVDGVIELSNLTEGISYLNFDPSVINKSFTDVNYFLKAQFNSNIDDKLYPYVYVFYTTLTEEAEDDGFQYQYNSLSFLPRSKNFIIICYKEKGSGILKYVEYKLDIKDIVNLICPFKLFETILKRYELDKSILEIKEKVRDTFKSMIFALKTTISKKWTESNTKFYYIENIYHGLAPATLLEIDTFSERVTKLKIDLEINKSKWYIPKEKYSMTTNKLEYKIMGQNKVNIKHQSYIIIQTDNLRKYKLIIKLEHGVMVFRIHELNLVNTMFELVSESINVEQRRYTSLVDLVTNLKLYPFKITPNKVEGYSLLGEPMDMAGII